MANFGVSQSRKEAGLRDVMRRHVTSFCSFIILGRFRFSTIYYEVSRPHFVELLQNDWEIHFVEWVNPRHNMLHIPR